MRTVRTGTEAAMSWLVLFLVPVAVEDVHRGDAKNAGWTSSIPDGQQEAWLGMSGRRVAVEGVESQR